MSNETSQNDFSESIKRSLKLFEGASFGNSIIMATEVISAKAERYGVSCQEITGQDTTWKEYFDGRLKEKAVKQAQEIYTDLLNTSSEEDKEEDDSFVDEITSLVIHMRDGKDTPARRTVIKTQAIRNAIGFAETDFAAIDIPKDDFLKIEKEAYKNDVIEDFEILSNPKTTDILILLNARDRILENFCNSIVKELKLDFTEIDAEEVFLKRAEELGNAASCKLTLKLQKIIKAQKPANDVLTVSEKEAFHSDLSQFELIVGHFAEIRRQSTQEVAQQKFGISKRIWEQLIKLGANKLFEKSA